MKKVIIIIMIMTSAIGIYYFITQQHDNNNVIIQIGCKYGRSKSGSCKIKNSKSTKDEYLAAETGIAALQVGAALAA